MAKAETERKKELLEGMLSEVETQIWMLQVDERTMQRLNVKEPGKFDNQLGALQAQINALTQKKGVIEEELKSTK